jgi:hypothetical protein
MLLVPTQPFPNQQIQITLGGQSVSLNIFQNEYGVFMDVYVGPTLIIAGVLCENLNCIVRDDYLGFIGDLGWFDSQGATDPVYTGFGIRYFLAYLEESDLVAAGIS